MILMLAPGPNMAFGSAPSGASYISSQYALVEIENNSTADQAYLQGAGCYTLTPFGGWGSSVFATLADLYNADLATGLILPGIIGFPQFMAATVTSDGTNTGTWGKTGSGSGGGSWTQISTDTFYGAQASAISAAASAAAAQLAEMGASALGHLYASISAGLAATSSGDYFAVAGDGTNTFAEVYLNSSGSAVLVASFPSKIYFDATMQQLRGTSSRVTTLAYDDFDRTNRTLQADISPTSQVYSITGAGASTVAISNGVVAEPSNLNFYASRHLGAQIRRATMQFRFDATGLASPTSQGSRQAVLIVQSSDLSLNNLQAHIECYIDSWICKTRVGGGSFSTAASGSWNLQPGIGYQMEVQLSADGTGLTIIDPYGIITTATVAANSGFVGEALSFQVFDGGTGATYAYDAKILACNGSTGGFGKIAALRALLLGGSSNELGAIRGAGFQQRVFPSSFIATSNSAYRIATAKAAPPGFLCTGLLELECQAANGTYENITVLIKAASTGTPVVTQINRINSGGPLTSIVVSNDGASAVAIDLTLTGATSAITVRRRFTGYATFIASPQPGATPLGGTAITFVPQAASAPPLTATALGTTGWYRVLQGASFSGFGISGTLTVVATDSAATEWAVFRVGGVPNVAGLSIQQVQDRFNVARVVSQARISRDNSATAAGIAVDVYLPNATTRAVALTVNFDGIGALLSAPTSGVSALGTESRTLALSGDNRMWATTTWDPPSLTTAAQQSTTIAVTDCVVGDIVRISFSNALQGTRMWGEVTAAGTVTVYHRNDTGGTVDLAAGTLAVFCEHVPA